MAYREVCFRIRTEAYVSERSSDADKAAFREESRRLFQELGWTLEPGCNGVCDTVTKDQQSEMEAGYSGWGFTASISGSVTTQSEHTRTTDKSAKYELYARAIQQPPAEGMAKLTSIVASVIEPIETNS